MDFSALRRLWTAKDLRNRLLITAGLIILYRLLSHVLAPGADAAVLTSARAAGSDLGFGFLDIVSGGTLSQASVLGMGVYPYITAQIILQLLTPLIPALKQRMDDDPRGGRELLEKWTMYLTIPMALINSIGQVQLIRSITSSYGQAFPQFGLEASVLLSTVTTLVSMTAGTMFAVWLGELISEYGLRGQGLSLIIFSGIVTRLPSNVISLWQNEATRWLSLLLFVVLFVITIFAIVVITQGRRNIPVMYPGRRIGFRQSMPVKGTLPLLVNMAGMIPIIFAGSILSLPQILGGIFANNQLLPVQQFGRALVAFNSQNWFYILLEFLMVVAFTFFYTDVMFGQQDYGENLKRAGAQIPGITKGESTQRYLNRVLRRITLPGALLLGAIAVLPLIVGALLAAAFPGTGSTGAYNGFSAIGSGLLIAVGTVKELFFNLDTELKTRGYDETLVVR
jgi:preprotein translocase subunit SecY